MQNELKPSSHNLLCTDLSKRIYGLDILRAIAILSVLINHGLEFLPDCMARYSYYLSSHGVTIFFVLSGFLIGRILINTFQQENFSKKSILKFWLNRWIRTVPPYYFALILLFLVIYGFDLVYKPYLSTTQIIRYFLFLQNFQYSLLPFWVESWSLPVEEWFYLITPLILFVLYKILRFDLKKAIIIMVLIITVSVLILRIYRYMNGIPYENQVVTRMDSLMFGVLGAFLMMHKNNYWNKNKVLFFLTGLSIIIITSIFNIGIDNFNPSLSRVLALTFVPALVLLMLPYLNSIKTGKGVWYKFFTYVSLISYSLYLFHHTLTKYIIVRSISEYFGNNKYIDGLLYWGISFAIATIVYVCLEKPCMDVRKKIKFLQK